MITLYLDFITHVGINGLNYILICISMDSNAGLHYKYCTYIITVDGKIHH